MRRRRCIIDSSCAIALDHLGLFPSLSLLFSLVLVPKAVREELHKWRQTKDRLQRLFEEYAFIERCDEYDRVAVTLVLAGRGFGTEDRGEAEAVVQAATIGATVLIDDKWGRERAVERELEVHGTVWVLQQLHQLGLLSASELRASFSSLRVRDIRLPWSLVDELLKHAGQEPLDFD